MYLVVIYRKGNMLELSHLYIYSCSTWPLIHLLPLHGPVHSVCLCMCVFLPNCIFTGLSKACNVLSLSLFCHTCLQSCGYFWHTLHPLIYATVVLLCYCYYACVCVFLSKIVSNSVFTGLREAHNVPLSNAHTSSRLCLILTQLCLA